MITGLAAILDNAHPWQALFQRVPHVCEHRGRDVGVTDQVVRCTDQFLSGKPADLDESVVTVGDHALGIGGGNQPLLSREGPLALCSGLVVTHGFFNPQGFQELSAASRI
ncbi:hypothetical protein D3C81_980290 [compost metagenome]